MATEMTRSQQLGSVERRAPSVLDRLASQRDRFLRLKARQGVQPEDLATAIKFLEHELGYKGLYTIESSGGHEGTKEIYDVVVATL